MNSLKGRHVMKNRIDGTISRKTITEIEYCIRFPLRGTKIQIGRP